MISNGYTVEWTSAINRTKSLGFTVPDHIVQPARRYLTSARQEEFPFVVQKGLGDLGFSDVVAQCMAIHYRMAPVIQEWLGCPALYTLGWIDDGTATGLFKFDEKFIAEKLKNGHQDSTIKIHAWITLPSMEVIDVSLATSIAVAQNLPNGFGRVLARPADGLNGMAYKPMLIGPDFLIKTGVLVQF